MEKLILRGVMWGADKIPDSVFEKMPGGFYKPKDDKSKKSAKHGDGDNRRSKRHSRRSHSDDGYEDDDDRYSDDGHRSDGHRQSRRHYRDSSYDGGRDEYDDVNHRRRRPRSTEHRSDDDQYAYREGHGRPARDSRYDDPRMGERPPYAEQPGYPTRSPVHPPPMGSRAPFSPPPPQSQTSSGSNGGAAGGYVPYAHIYGQPAREPPPQHPFSPPPPSHTSSVRPTSMNQVAPPPPPSVARQQYQQNPFAQEAPPGSQPSYMPNPYYNPRQPDERYTDQQQGRGRGRDRESDDYSQSPPRQRSRRDRSTSRDSYDDHSSSRRRARSERRGDDTERGKSHQSGRGKSRLREAFDASERGLGYSAVGALAGGLVGSEVGKGGALPAVIGTAVGALGANVFQARERYDPRRQRQQQQQQQQPSPPSLPRKKEAARYERNRGEDLYGSGEEGRRGRRAEGYRSE